MYLNQYKILTGISLLSMSLITVLLPAVITLSIIAFAMVFSGLYFIVQNYDIDYKYWFSFIGQLLALILIVSIFVAIFSFFVSLIAQ